MNILITNGRVIDPASGFDQLADVAVAHGKVLAISAIGTTGTGLSNFVPQRTIDARDCIVMPGLVD